MSHSPSPTTKRHFPTPTTATAFPPMKKAKSEAVSASFPDPSPPGRNGLSHRPPPVNSSAGGDGFFVNKDDPKLEETHPPNLARKKAKPPPPPKKFVIKLNKGKPMVPTNFEEDTWGMLQSAIKAIFLKQQGSCELKKLYQAIFDLCLHKMGGNLYSCIDKECEENIAAMLQSLVGQSPDLVVFLLLIERCWHDFCDQILMIHDITLFLDRTYMKQRPDLSFLWDMGL